MVRRFFAFLPVFFCAVLLFARLGRPALWQDEAETALLAESVLAHGYPAVNLNGRRISGQPDLKAYESNAAGVWIWDTWAPYYLAAAGLALLGHSNAALRFPFALAAFLAFLLASRLFRLLAKPGSLAPNFADWLLAFNVPWLLFMRQCRYYSLACLGILASVHAYRLVLKGRRAGPWLLGGSLLFLFHSFFALGPLALAVFGLDAARRSGEAAFQRRFWPAIGAVVLLCLPAALYFKIGSRHGIHDYGLKESCRFLQTYLLWITQFALALPLLLFFLFFRARERGSKRAWVWGCGLLAAGAAAALGLAGEGLVSLLVSLAIYAGLAVWALSAPASGGEISGRLPGLFITGALALFSLKGAEPYGRYLAPFLPFFCFALAACLAEAGQRWGPVLMFLCLTTNALFMSPIGWAAAFERAEPGDTVSSMMRERLRAVPLRSDILSFAAELRRGAGGYVEPISSFLNKESRPGELAFAASDNLCYMYYTKLTFLDPGELQKAIPAWIIPSPWLELLPRAKQRIADLLRARPYEATQIEAPDLLWQSSPDILFHVFEPPIGRRMIYHLSQKP